MIKSRKIGNVNAEQNRGFMLASKKKTMKSQNYTKTTKVNEQIQRYL